jgi:branched-chain amino acid transport system substrate-binding protein
VLAKGGDPTNTAQLQAALEANPEFPSLYGGSADQVGTVKFDVKEHTISKPMAVFKVENGKPVQIQSIQKVAQSADPKTALLQ